MLHAMGLQFTHQQLAAAQGSIVINGQSVALTATGARTLAMGQGSLAITGQSVGLVVARKLTAARRRSIQKKQRLISSSIALPVRNILRRQLLQLHA